MYYARVGQGAPGGSPILAPFPARALPTSAARCKGSCEIRRDPSLLAPVVTRITSANDLQVFSVSVDGWANVLAAVSPTTKLGGFVRVEQLSGISAPSPLSPLNRFPTDVTRADQPLPNFPSSPDRPLPAPQEPAPEAPPSAPNAPPPASSTTPPTTSVLPSITTNVMNSKPVEVLILSAPLWGSVLLSWLLPRPR